MSEIFLSSTNSKNDIIKAVAEYSGRKSYFLIDYTGKIKRKSVNLCLPLIAAMDETNIEKITGIINESYIWKDERKKIKKPDRLTKLSVEELKKNLFKTIQNCEPVFAVRFANELFLREYEALKEIILFSSCINRDDIVLPLMAISAIKLLEDKEIEYFYPLYMIIEMLSLYPKNYKEYESAYLGKDGCYGKNNISRIRELSEEIQNKAFNKSLEILKKSGFENTKFLETIKTEDKLSENISEIELIIKKGIEL